MKEEKREKKDVLFRDSTIGNMHALFAFDD